MDTMETDLRHAGRIPQETLDYLSNKTLQTLKTDRDQKLRWLTAGILFIACECLALAIFFMPHNRSHFQFHPIALFILPLLATPWLSARMALRRYKLLGEPTIQANIQADISYRLASLVFFAYTLFMAGMVTALIKMSFLG